MLNILFLKKTKDFIRIFYSKTLKNNFTYVPSILKVKNYNKNKPNKQ